MSKLHTTMHQHSFQNIAQLHDIRIYATYAGSEKNKSKKFQNKWLNGERQCQLSGLTEFVGVVLFRLGEDLIGDMDVSSSSLKMSRLRFRILGGCVKGE